jgi:hypothetical protein
MIISSTENLQVRFLAGAFLASAPTGNLRQCEELWHQGMANGQLIHSLP